MDGDSRAKVMAAGFTILRTANEPAPKIKVLLETHGSWGTFEGGFKSKAARDRRLKELLQQPTIITD
jgi:hypothetical protein